MIFKEIEKQIEGKQQGEFLYPRYESYCFLNFHPLFYICLAYEALITGSSSGISPQI